MNDPYVRVLLTVIAVSLAVIALSGLVPDARATDRLQCEIDGPLDIRISDIQDEIQVELEERHGVPGSSSSYPVYVRVQD